MSVESITETDEETIAPSDEWSAEELAIMRKRGRLIFPNRKVAREMWLESLRLAVEISPKSGDWRQVLETAQAFEGFLTGRRMIDLSRLPTLPDDYRPEVFQALK